MINISNIRQDEEFIKKYKNIFENLLEEFKDDTNILSIEIVVDNHESSRSAIYIDFELYINSKEEKEDLIVRVMNYIRGCEDWLILNLFIGADYSIFNNDESSVETYSLNTSKNIVTETNVTYLYLSHYYGDEERAFNYNLRDVDKEKEKSKQSLIQRIGNVFKDYELDDLEYAYD